MSTLLNEEIKRIKSLFTEERLYGNLVDLITEDTEDSISQADQEQIKKLTLKQPSSHNKMIADILINGQPITADIVADGPTGPTPVSIKQVHLNKKNQIIVSGIADVPNPLYPAGPKFIPQKVTKDLGKIKEVGNRYEWKPNKKIYDQFVAKGTDEQKAVFNAFIKGIITDYNFGKAVLAATTKGSNVTGTEIITTWQSSSTPAEKVKPAEEVTEEVEYKGVFMPGTTDVKKTGVVTEKSATEMKFEYTGPEFYGVDDDPAHALANTVAAKVGEQLKSLYDAGIYVQVNLNKITYETTPIKCNKEKWPDTTDESKCINFKISVPFVKVEDKCQAFTSIEHGGSWGGNEAEANTTTNKSKAEKINLDGDEFDVSKKIIDNNKKVTEYWFQWRNKGKQEADCSGDKDKNTAFPYTVEEREGKETPKEEEEEIVNRNKPEHLNNIKAGQKNGVIYKGKNDLVKRGKKLVDAETDKAFTGIVYTEDGNEGLQKEVTYEKGIPSGEYTTYYPNGDVKIMIDNGEWKSYYPSGETWVEGKLKGNLRSGVWKFYHKNGQLAKETSYQSGEKHGMHKEWDENGTQTVEELWKNDINRHKVHNPSTIYNKKYVN